MRLCIPTGHGRPTQSLRLQTNGDEDLIYQAMLAQNFLAGAGLVRKQANRVVHAVEDDRLSKPSGGSILRRAAAQAQPENSGLARELVGDQRKAIDAGKK